MFKVMVRPALLYGIEAVAVTKTQEDAGRGDEDVEMVIGFDKIRQGQK